MIVLPLFWRFGVYLGPHAGCSRVTVTNPGDRFRDYRRVVNTLFFDVADWWPRDVWIFLAGR